MSAHDERHPETLVVGIDASPESHLAVAWARAAARLDDRIVLVHAWQMPVVTGYDMVVTVDPREVEALAQANVDKQLAELGDPRASGRVAHGLAGRALVEAAEELDATMIVVGHRGYSRMAMMLGSNANYVLHHSTRPVVVVRGDHVGDEAADPNVMRPRRVVVGVDDHGLTSESAATRQGADNPSVRALRWAYGLAGVEQIRVVHAWFLPSLAIGMFADVSADLSALDGAAQAVVDHVLAAAGPPPAGVEVVGEPIRGTPGFGLIEASRDADLVVVGSRGRGGFAGLVLGSATTEVAAHSHAPVAVIR